MSGKRNCMLIYSARNAYLKLQGKVVADYFMKEGGNNDRLDN